MMLRPQLTLDDGPRLGSQPELGLSMGDVGATVLLKDTFTDTNGTNLTAHTMDVGPGWTALVGSITINGNQAGSLAPAFYVADAGKADVTASVDATEGSGSRDAELAFRVTDANNYWDLTPDWALHTLTINEVVSGTPTARASGSSAITQNNPTNLKAVCSGSAIAAYSGGTLSCSYGSAATGLSATKHGIRAGGANANNWDNFLVTNP